MENLRDANELLTQFKKGAWRARCLCLKVPPPPPPLLSLTKNAPPLPTLPSSRAKVPKCDLRYTAHHLRDAAARVLPPRRHGPLQVPCQRQPQGACASPSALSEMLVVDPQRRDHLTPAPPFHAPSLSPFQSPPPSTPLPLTHPSYASSTTWWACCWAAPSARSSSASSPRSTP